MLLRKIPVYHITTGEGTPLQGATLPCKDFLLSLPPLRPLLGEERTLFSVEGCLSAALICRTLDLQSQDGEMHSLRRENCFAFCEENEWILDITFTTVTREGVADTASLRLPLSMPRAADEPLALYFDGVWFRLLLGGEVVNENAGVGDLAEPGGPATAIAGVTLAPALARQVTYRTEESSTPLDFYFPHGFNTNVGDVMSFFHDGTLHLLYLLDRRHHGSRNGRGAHIIAHITTKDLVTWEEQEPIAEIEKPYETFGTGTMFYHGGRYYMSYGIHTSRHPSGKFVEPSFDGAHGCFTYKTFEEAEKEGGMPMGATVSVSEDGIRFKRSGLLYHASQNPSAYANDHGGITLYGGYGGEGIWEAEAFGKPFYRVKSDLVFSGPETGLSCSSECPAFFTMGEYRYLIVGFRGYFRTLSPHIDQLVDAIKMGETIYDGLCVPMVAELDNGRRLMAGWICSELGWGGALMQRELIQEPDGKLGMKWIPELAPVPQGENLFCRGAALQEVAPRTDYLLTGMAVAGEDGVFALDIIGQGQAAQLRVDTASGRAQITESAGDGSLQPLIDTPYERRVKEGDYPFGSLQSTARYAMADMPLGPTFSLKMMLRYSTKMRGVVCDIELGGKRTMITLRANMFATHLRLVAGELAEGTLHRI